MTKKFLALTMVLVLAAGFAAVAAENTDKKPLTGMWNNEFTLDPQANEFAGLTSKLDVTYTANGITYTSVSKFNVDEFAKQEFGVDSSVGLLDLTSTLNMDPSGGNLRFWESGADLTVGGVNIGGDFYLQKQDWDPTAPGYQATFWPEISANTYPKKPSFGDVSSVTQTDSFMIGSDVSKAIYDYGSGFELTFSGETPGGVSVDVTNTFGMMPTSNVEADLTDLLDSKVKSDLTGGSDLDTIGGQAAYTWLKGLVNQNGTSSVATADELTKAMLVSQIGIGDTNASGEDYSDFSQLAADYDQWETDLSNEYAGTGSFNTDPNSEFSDKVRNAALAIVQKSVILGGVAAETGKVVNTEFELGDVEFLVDASAATSSSSASASLYLDTVEVGAGQYGGSSLQYYSTLVELDNLSIGCCDFSNETKFTEDDGFAYTEFGFSMTNKDFPISIDATLEWDNTVTPGGKSVSLTPSLSTDWACFTVYTDLSTSDSSTVIEGMEVEGFKLSAELGHVNVTSITALGSDNVDDLVSGYHAYDEVLAIDKLASAGDLDFSLDVYTDMDGGLMPKAIDGSASYPISDQFTLGSSMALQQDGLKEVGLSLDYSF